MTYTATVSGVKVTCNYPVDNTPMPSGTSYVIDIYLNNSIEGLLVELGLDIIQLGSRIQNAIIVANTVEQTKITNFQIKQISTTQIEISFSASSPAALVVALGIIAALAVFAYFISQIAIQINKPNSPLGIFSYSIAFAVFAIVALTAYLVFRDPKFRRSFSGSLSRAYSRASQAKIPKIPKIDLINGKEKQEETKQEEKKEEEKIEN